MNFESNTNVVEVAVRRLRSKLDDPFAKKLLHPCAAWATCWKTGTLRMRNPRSLGRWLSWWLAVQTFIGLGFVCASSCMWLPASTSRRSRPSCGTSRK